MRRRTELMFQVATLIMGGGIGMPPGSGKVSALPRRGRSNAKQPAARQRKTPVPGALGRGFILSVRHASRPALFRSRATGGKPASRRPVLLRLLNPGFLLNE